MKTPPKPLRKNTPAPVVTKEEKVAYVKGQGQTRDHHCHYPGCTKTVPPAMWGCYSHWMRLPRELRDKVWEAYSIGQEVSMSPSREYIKVVNEVEDWIRTNFRCKACLGSGRNSNDDTCYPCKGSGVTQ